MAEGDEVNYKVNATPDLAQMRNAGKRAGRAFAEGFTEANKMVQIALEKGLNVTENGKPLSKTALASISGQINQNRTASLVAQQANNAIIPLATKLPNDMRFDKILRSVKGIHVEAQNSIQSFWSVWSISWMIRGTLQNIFGYSSKWVGEVNKLTRAFQAGLYMYAGMSRISTALSKKILERNASWVKAVGQQELIAYKIKPAIAKIQDQITAHGKIDQMVSKEQLLTLQKQGVISGGLLKIAQERGITEKDLLANLKAEEKAYATQAVELKGAALQSTQGIRGFLTGGAMKAVAGIAVASVALGVVQWISSVNEQTNKSIVNMRGLGREIGALGNPLSTVKTSFTDVDGLIQKITKEFPDMADTFNMMTDPAQKVGTAFGVIAEQSNKSMKPTWTLKKSLHEIGENFHNFIGEWKSGWTGKTPPLIENAQQYTANLVDLFAVQDKNAGEYEYLNLLLGAHNRVIKDNLKSTNGITAAGKKWNKVIATTMALAMVKKPLEDYDKQIKKLKDSIDETTTAQEKAIINYRIAQIEQDKHVTLIMAEHQALHELKVAQGEATEATKTASKASTSTPMTWLQYYTSMYNAYKTAAKNSTKYSDIALKTKNLLIKTLKSEIATIDKEIKGVGYATDKWKQLNVQKAKDIEQLTQLISLQEKMNSTWYNIPSAVIKPTKSQLTAGNFYLNPEFNIHGNTTEELTQKFKTVIDNYAYSNDEVQQGTVGGVP